MTESPQQPSCSQKLLGVLPAPTNDVGSTTELPPREGRTGELRGGGPCQGPCLSLADVLPWPHPCIVSYVKNNGILFTYPWKFIPRKNLTPRKFVPIQYPEIANGQSLLLLNISSYTACILSNHNTIIKQSFSRFWVKQLVSPVQSSYGPFWPLPLAASSTLSATPTHKPSGQQTTSHPSSSKWGKSPAQHTVPFCCQGRRCRKSVEVTQQLLCPPSSWQSSEKVHGARKWRQTKWMRKPYIHVQALQKHLPIHRNVTILIRSGAVISHTPGSGHYIRNTSAK